jgi:hypothetical protein
MLVKLIAGAVDAIVVEWRSAPDIDTAWPDEIWWGSRDMHIEATLPEGYIADALNVESLDSSWLRGVKVGIAGSGKYQWSRICVEVEELSRRATNSGLEIVLEPYFDRSDSAELRREVLRRTTANTAIRYLKLDAYEPEMLREYDASSTVPWLVRSDGRRFSTFARSLQCALAHGCVGSMVGGAIWSDCLTTAELTPEGSSKITDRIESLRRIVA